MAKSRPLWQPRDKDGWRVPRGGLSREIYRMAKAGKKRREIVKALGVNSNMVGVLLHNMKHPDRANARGRAFTARQAELRTA
jgi:hypothetical protein